MAGAIIIATEYRHGGGKAGNVGAGMINTPLNIPGNIEITNERPAVGGRDEQDIEELMAEAPDRLRSRNRAMPEEINRVLTDRLSDFLFTTCRDADNNLIREGIPKENIHFVGNVMIDTLIQNADRAEDSKVLHDLKLFIPPCLCGLTIPRQVIAAPGPDLPGLEGLHQALESGFYIRNDTDGDRT